MPEVKLPALYGELVSWYRLLDPPADHAEEAALFQRALERGVSGAATTLLELGAGAGHNAVHLAPRFTCTLTDLSAPMLGLSRETNPNCEHVQGDMRSLRLSRQFDAVLVHDAVMYLTSREDLLATARTAFAHTRPGGAALFAPDCVRETLHEGAQLEGSSDGPRELKCLMWTRDPDPADETYLVDFAFLLREGAEVKAASDQHVEGVFPRATWVELLTLAGYEVEHLPWALEGDDERLDRFLCRRPG